MRNLEGCCVAGMGSWVDDVGELMRTAGEVYQGVTARPTIQMPTYDPGWGSPTWGSGQPTYGTTSETFFPTLERANNLMPLLLLGSLAFLLWKR